MFRNKKDHKKIARILGYEFKDEALLLRALTRRSALNEGLQSSYIGDFQRLEFIGDKVLNLVISDIIFDNYPDWNEGELTIEVSKFTNNKGPLAEIAQSLKLDRFLIMGLGEEKSKVRDNVKVLSDALEALIGALWIDSESNYKFIKKFIAKQFKLLGLIDFNETYREGIIKNFARSFAAELAEDIMPFCDLESVGGMSLSEMIAFKQAKARATKPLSGLVAALEEIERYSSNDSVDDTVKNENESILGIEHIPMGINKYARNLRISTRLGSLAGDNDEETAAFHTRKDIATEELEDSEKLRSRSPKKSL